MTTHSCIFPLPVVQVRPHSQHWYLQAQDDTKFTLLCLSIARWVCSTHLLRRRWQHSCIYPLPGVWVRPTVSPWTGMCKPRMKTLLYLPCLEWRQPIAEAQDDDTPCLPSAHGVCQTHFPHWYRQDNYTLISTLCLECGVIPPLKQRISTLLYLLYMECGVIPPLKKRMSYSCIYLLPGAGSDPLSPWTGQSKDRMTTLLYAPTLSKVWGQPITEAEDDNPLPKVWVRSNASIRFSKQRTTPLLSLAKSEDSSI